MSDKNHFMFLFNLFEYNLRKERALGYEEPSLFLQSLQSAILLETSLSFIKSAQRLGEADKLYTTITSNREKITRLSKKIQKTRSEKRARTWYTIVLRLYEEAEKAQEKLAELEANG